MVLSNYPGNLVRMNRSPIVWSRFSVMSHLASRFFRSRCLLLIHFTELSSSRPGISLVRCLSVLTSLDPMDHVSETLTTWPSSHTWFCLLPSRAGGSGGSWLAWPPASLRPCGSGLLPSCCVEGAGLGQAHSVSPATIGICCVFGLSLFACFSLECGNRFISSRRELVPLTRALLLILHFFLHSQVSKG